MNTKPTYFWASSGEWACFTTQEDIMGFTCIPRIEKPVDTFADYIDIQKTHQHICYADKCNLPKKVQMSQIEYENLNESLQKGEKPARFYKGMEITICQQ